MNEQTKNILLLSVIVFFGVISRFLPHPPNFTPLTAIALFAGAYLLKSKWAYIIPIGALLISDFILQILFWTGVREFPGFYPNMILVYGAFALVVAIGTGLKGRIKVLPVMGSALLASLLFFVITNFGSWLSLPMYTKDFSGLMSAYAAGIPFYKWTMLGDLLYTGVLFTAFETVIQSSPAVQRITKS